MWQKIPQDLTKLDLNFGAIHIYLIDLNSNFYQVDELSKFCDQNELIRSKNFKFQNHQNFFILTRGILRIILSKYLDITPQEIIFNYSEKGKPYIETSLNQNEIQFNLSHSENLVLYAITKQSQIGIDIEKIRDNCNVTSLAKRFFTPNEYQIIKELNDQKKYQIFFQTWTLKEAYLKAIGLGLSGGLDSLLIDINSLDSDLIKFQINQQIVNDWLLKKIEIDSNFMAAIAIQTVTQNLTIKYFII